MRRALVSGSALLILLFVPFSSATNPDVVESVSAEVTLRELYGGPLDLFDVDINVTWQLSANDPDQVNGDWGYRFVYGEGEEPSLWLDVTPVPITDRSGWVSAVLQVAGSGVGTYNITVVANDTAAEPADAAASELSCVMEIDARDDMHAECGTGIEAPPGVSAIVVAEATADYGANTTVRWALSEDDPNQTAGDYDYWVYSGEALDAMFNRSDITISQDSDGVLRATLEDFTAPAGTFPQYVKVMARDPLTYQRSDFSCVVFVQGGEIYERQACGVLGSPSGGFSSGDATFPFVDISDVAAESGMTESIVGAMLGGTAVLGFALMGFKGAGVVGGFVAGILTLAFVAVLSILPSYVLVVVFLAALAIVVFAFRGRGG